MAFGNSRGFLCPKFSVVCAFHLPSTLGAGALVPLVDVARAAAKAKTADGGAETGGDIAYHAAHNEGLYGFAVGTQHGYNALTHEAFSLVDLRLVAAGRASVTYLPSHGC